MDSNVVKKNILNMVFQPLKRRRRKIAVVDTEMFHMALKSMLLSCDLCEPPHVFSILQISSYSTMFLSQRSFDFTWYKYSNVVAHYVM